MQIENFLLFYIIITGLISLFLEIKKNGITCEKEDILFNLTLYIFIFSIGCVILPIQLVNWITREK